MRGRESDRPRTGPTADSKIFGDAACRSKRARSRTSARITSRRCRYLVSRSTPRRHRSRHRHWLPLRTARLRSASAPAKHRFAARRCNVVLSPMFWRWWRKRRKKVQSTMARYDHAEINTAFTRIPCMSCGDWRSDSVKAKVAAFLIAHWDGQNPKPPSPRARRAQRQRRYRQRVRLRPATR